ncbi:MAG: TerC family protein [Syntrophomonas sp.]
MFGYDTLVVLGSIIILDLVLGGDNAILIALASKNLSPEQQKKARLWGIAGAILARAVLTTSAVYLLKIPLLNFIGGVLLLWIAVKLLVEEKEIECQECYSLSEAVRIIIMADVVMGIDNMVAVAGAAHGNILMVFLGLLISVPIIVWGSTIILHWIERYPIIVYLGAAVLAWTAGQMIGSDALLKQILEARIPCYDWLLQILSIIGVLSIGYYRNRALNKNQVVE